MLPRLVLCLYLGVLDARDGYQISQKALLWAVDDTKLKPENIKGAQKRGCPVEEPCSGASHSGDFVSLGWHHSENTPASRNSEAGNHEVLVFVSLSMPEASLKSLFHEANKHKAVLVMRGLYEDSFVKTATKLQQLGITVDIHPELFEKYHIERVPVFVRLDKGREIARLSGNVSLGFAVSKLAEVS